MAIEGDAGDRNLPAMVYALDHAATVILLELAKERGKGPWFGGLLNRLQFQLAKSSPPEGAPDAIKATWRETVHGTAHDVFRRVLMDPSVPDWRPRTNPN